MSLPFSPNEPDPIPQSPYRRLRKHVKHDLQLLFSAHAFFESQTSTWLVAGRRFHLLIFAPRV